MACFIVPAVEAIATTVAAKVLESKAKEQDVDGIRVESKLRTASRRIQCLSNLLWGGSALLAFEHLWHGEIIPWFPFLTAASNPADMVEMLHEMSTVGVTMALAVTAVWGISCIVVNAVNKHEEDSVDIKKTNQ